ncbi:tetratricopeptide repeat protein [Bacteroidota bacterium]
MIILFAGIGNSVFAQKKKDKKRKKDDNQYVISKDDLRLAELYFTEAEKYYILEDYAKAYVLFQKALELNPDNGAIHYMIAQIFEKSDELDNALFHAQEALKFDPKNKYYYLLLTDIYTKQSNFSKVTEVFEEMIRVVPGTEEYLFEIAAYYIYQEDFDNALKCYNRIEEKFGVSEQVSLQKKNIYIRKGELDNAIAEIKKLIESYPGEPTYLLQLAEILMTNEKLDQAIEILKNAEKQYPDNTRIQLYLYESYKKIGHFDQAKEALDKAFYSTNLSMTERRDIINRLLTQLPNKSVEKDLFRLANATLEAYPNESESYIIYGNIFYQLDSLNPAKEMYRKALDLDNSKLNAWQNLLDIELRNNELDSVIEHSESALELYPNHALIYYFNGTAHLIKNNHLKAVRSFEQGKRLSSSNLELRAIFNGQLGDAYNGIQEHEKSDKAYEEALEFDPNSDHVLNNYSYFLSLRKEKLDLAHKMSSKLIKKNPDNATYLDTHAWVLYNLGNIEEARKHIEKAIKQSENVSGTIIEHYGDILFKLGDVDEAVKQWQKAKGMDESSDLLIKKIADRQLYE